MAYRKATAISVFSGFAAQAFIAVSGILAARLLGVEDRGYLAILTAFALGLNSFGLMGVPQSITYYVSVDRSRGRSVWTALKPTFIRQVVILTALHAVFLFVYLRQKPPEVVLAGWYTVIAVPGLLATQYALSFFKGAGNYSEFSFYRILPAFAYAVLMAVAVFMRGNLAAVSLFWSAIYLLVGFGTLRLSLLRLSGDAIDPVDRQAEIHRYAVKGWAGSISALQTFRLDQLAAGLFLSPSAAGLYVVALAFTNLPMFISQSIGFIAAPALSSGSSDKKTSALRFKKFFWAAFAMNVLVTVTLFFLLPVLLPFLFGQDFIDSVPIGKILMIAAFFLSMRVILGELYRGLGRPEIASYGEVSLMVFLCATAPWLMMRHGLTGLAVSVAVAYAVSALVVWVTGRRSRLKNG